MLSQDAQDQITAIIQADLAGSTEPATRAALALLPGGGTGAILGGILAGVPWGKIIAFLLPIIIKILQGLGQSGGTIPVPAPAPMPPAA